MKMDYEYKKIPRLIEKKEYYPDGANSPTIVEVHKCFCRKGTIEYHYVPGFNDDWFEINCERCDEKYHPFIDICGRKWKVYLAK